MKKDEQAQPQPWHAADEKKTKGGPPKGGPIGTHSLTGGGLNVGMPSTPRSEGEAERSTPREEVPTGEPPLVDEPRAGRGDLLGTK